MERATIPKDKFDKTRSQQIRSTTSERRVGASLYAFLEGKEVKEANAEYRSWSSFSPDPVLIKCPSDPNETRVEFSGLSFRMIKEESGEILYHFSARKTARGWHTRDSWHLELRIYNEAGVIVGGMAHGIFDLITVAGVYCMDDGNKVSSMNGVALNVWNDAYAVEITVPSHTIHKC